MNELIQYQLEHLPDEPGVYLMKNELGDVIYVGKAKSLRKRVRQYFMASRNQTLKVRKMVEHIHEIDYIVVNNEVESLVLEANLIKQYRTKYNILLRDDKQYPYIKITNEPFPQVIKVRERESDGSKYFGPFPSAYDVNKVLELIYQHFPIRFCRYHLPQQSPARPCLNYQIKRCSGACTGHVSVVEYGEMIQEVTKLIEGKDKSLLYHLEDAMKVLAKDLKFEEAAALRDSIQSLKNIWVSQIVDNPDIASAKASQDVIGLARMGDIACVSVFFVRDGKIIGRDTFMMEHVEEDDDSSIMTSFIHQFYAGSVRAPQQILLSRDINNKEESFRILSALSGTSVTILYPKIGEKRNLALLSEKNALDYLQRREGLAASAERKREKLLDELAQTLNLIDLPRRIEVYDISHISGTDAVGAMVVYEDGKEKKSDYRKFRIKSGSGGDDYHSMQEVIRRRMKRAVERKPDKQYDPSFSTFPDLLLIDGGITQVNAVEAIVESYGVFAPVCGMVKDDKHNTRALYFEGKEIDISENRELFVWIAQMQSEVHRFAIDYHRTLRSKRTISSLLDEIPGIGPKRKKLLLQYFGDIQKIAEASYEDLREVPGINDGLAKTIKEHVTTYQAQKVAPK